MSEYLNGLIDLPWWGYVLTTLALTHISIASITIFLHRAQAHRALDLSPSASHFFRFWLWLTTGAVTKEWVSVHRKHHAKCETAEDPHSPVILGIGKVLTQGYELYQAEAGKAATRERYGHGTPDDWLERNLYSGRRNLGIVLMLIIDLALFGAIGLTIWAAQMLWMPVFAAGIINGAGHYYGYRNFACDDASTNILPWGILIGGEELHNNHHAYGSSAKLSNRWYEFDIGWGYIRVLAFFRLAKVKKIAPKVRWGEIKHFCDVELLQSVVTHRYDVLTRYARGMKRTYAEELDKLGASLPQDITLKQARAWFGRNLADLKASERLHLQILLAQSPRLDTLYQMRQELTALWSRSTASSEQLARQLQDWCQRAESSGIEALSQFSLRLRRYA